MSVYQHEYTRESLHDCSVKDTQKVLKKVLQKNHAILDRTLKACLVEVAKDLFSVDLITRSVLNDPTYGKIESEFQSGMELKEDISELEKHCKLFLDTLSSQGGPVKSAADILAKEWTQEAQRESNVQLQFKQCTRPSVKENAVVKSLISIGGHESSPATSKVHLLTPENEKEIQKELKSLHATFTTLKGRIREELEIKLKKEELTLETITIFIQDHLDNAENFTNIPDVMQLFQRLERYSDFLDCEVIEVITEKFVKGNLVTELQAHSTSAETFRETQSVIALREYLRSVYVSPFSNSESPEVAIFFNKPWSNVAIKHFKTLISHLLPRLEGQSLWNHIQIFSGSVCIEYAVQDTQVDSLIAHTQEKLQFMHLIGIFQLIINGKLILEGEENNNFTFDFAILQAVKVANTEAACFLLQLEININYQDEEGKIALIATPECKEDKITTPDIQDYRGSTALMIASEKNEYLIARHLLNANANPNIQRQDGKTALIIACENKHLEMVKLLLEFDTNLSQTTKGGDTALTVSLRDNSYKLIEALLPKHNNFLPELIEASKMGQPNIISTFIAFIEKLCEEKVQFSFKVDLLCFHSLITNLGSHSIQLDEIHKNDDSSSVFSDDSAVGSSIVTEFSIDAPSLIEKNNEVLNKERSYVNEKMKYADSSSNRIVPLRRAADTYMIEYKPELSCEHQLLVKLDLDHTAEMIPMVPSPLQQDRWITTISHLDHPWGIALTNNKGYIIMTEYYGNRVTVFDNEGRNVCFFAHKINEEMLSCPAGVAVTRNDRILLVDQNNQCIREFTIAVGDRGEYIKYITSVGMSGSAPLEFKLPVGIGVHPISGQIYVCDAENHRIQVLNEDLTFSHQIGSTAGIRPKEFRRPYSIDFDESGNIYVVDKFNKRIQKLSIKGNFLTEFGVDHLYSPEGIAISKEYVYVSDCRDHTIAEFTLDGKFMRKFGGKGERYEKGLFKNPSGLAIDPDGYLYICDKSNWRVQVL